MSRRRNSHRPDPARTAEPAKSAPFATDGNAVVEVRDNLSVGTSEHVNMAARVTGDKEIAPARASHSSHSSRSSRSSVEIPLMRHNIEQHKSVLERVNAPADKSDTKEEQGDSIFALDIGTRTVVGVYGNADDDAEKFIMQDYVTLGHTKRAMIDGQVEDIRQVAKIVAEVKNTLEERNNVKLTKVSIAAAGRALRTRKTSMDFDISGSGGNAGDGITFEMVKSMELETIQKAQDEIDKETGGESYAENNSSTFHCVGFSVTKYRLDDYSIISLEGHKGKVATIELIATFLPNVVVEGLYSVMELNGLEVASLTLEPIAAMNAIIPAEIRLINIALVDIGAGTSDIAISKDGSIIAYGMATTAGDEITEEVIKHYFVDFDTAEQIKLTACSGKSYVYKDIFGIEQNISPEVFASDIHSAVELLAETICVNIINANGTAPSAVFLIGGGSLVCGLPELVAEKLGIDRTKVAIGNEQNLRTIDAGGHKMGAEFITPLGIAMTCILNKGYDFSVITLNGRKIRVFDTKKLSVFELLNMTGYKSDEIMGRSGRSLTYVLNGAHTSVKGGNLEPAVVKVNGAAASLNTYVAEGDTVEFTPAVCGKNGTVTLAEVVNYDKYSEGYVSFSGEKYEIGVDVRVNNKRMEKSYSVQPLDEIEVYGILTIDDLMQHLDVEFDGLLYKANGRFAEGTYVLKNGDVIEIAETSSAVAAPAPVAKPAPAVADDFITAVPVSMNNVVSEHENSFAPAQGAIDITINDKHIMLPPTASEQPHMFLELLNYADLDMDDPKGSYTMTLNGIQAGFQDMLSDGDVAVIKWDENDRIAYGLNYNTDTAEAADEIISREITVDVFADVADAVVDVTSDIPAFDVFDDIDNIADTVAVDEVGTVAVDEVGTAEVDDDEPAVIDWESNEGFDALFGTDYTKFAVDKSKFPDIFDK